MQASKMKGGGRTMKINEIKLILSISGFDITPYIGMIKLTK
jgi:hypothetical protein